MSWNNYPKYVRDSFIKRLQQKKLKTRNDNDSDIKIWFRVPYLGSKGEGLVKSCIQKLKRCVKTNVKFVILYDTKKSAMFCSAKDKIPTHQKSNVVYSIRCPGCGDEYVAKTDRCVITRMREHATHVPTPCAL